MLLHIACQITSSMPSSTPFDLLHHNTNWSFEAKETCIDVIMSFLSTASSLLNDYQTLIMNKEMKIIHHNMIIVACQKQHPQNPDFFERMRCYSDHC